MMATYVKKINLAFFHKNVIGVMSIVVYVSQIGSACTLKCNRMKNRLEFCTKSTSFLIIILLLSMVHLCFTPSVILQLQNLKLKDGTLEYNLQHYVSTMLCPLLVAFVAIMFRLIILINMNKSLPRMIDQIFKADILLKYNQNDSHLNDTKFVLIFTFVLIVLSFPFQIYSNFGHKTGTNTSTLIFATNIYNNYTTTCVEFQFITITYLLYKRFQFINHKLKVYNRHVARRNNMNAIAFLCDENQRNLRILQEIKFVDDLSTMKESYQLLLKSCKLLNKAYSLQLLITLLSSGCNVLLNLYFSIFGGFNVSSQIRSWTDIVNDVSWGFYYFIKMFFISFACHCTTNEGNSTKELLSNLLSKQWKVDTSKEIWMFHAYLTSVNIEFNACGFFQIKLSLITTALTVGSTYLVMLAQFHNM